MATAGYTQFNCYMVLGIPRTAGPQDVRTAYRQASLRTHPDRGGSHEQQIRINLAYEILTDPVLRQAHDRYWFRDGATSGRSSSTDARSTARPSAPPRPEPIAEPLGHVYHRAHQRIEDRQREAERRRQTRYQQTVQDFEARFTQAKQNRRNGLIWSCVLTAGAVLGSSAHLQILWFAAIISWLWFMAHASGVRLKVRKVRFDDPTWRDAVRMAAAEVAEAEFNAEQERLNSYHKVLAALSEFLGRSSSLADAEDQVARRITCALFVMGYQPLQYDRQARILIFTDGQDRMLVRFRHRSGVPTNVTYVEKMIEAMRLHKAGAGLLFCTPGLSGNGAALAMRHGVKWYTLERMKEWINEVMLGEYDGPAGDILEHLDHLITFIRSISVPLPYHGRRT